MEPIIIEIPGRKIKFKAKNISEAIKKLNQLTMKKEVFDAKKIATEFYGVFKEKKYNYKVHEEDWYKQ